MLRLRPDAFLDLFFVVEGKIKVQEGFLAGGKKGKEIKSGGKDGSEKRKERKYNNRGEQDERK